MALEANRLFKQEFGDKIESLQTEVEQLRRQRFDLEMELAKARERQVEGDPASRLSSTPHREARDPENTPKLVAESPSRRRDRFHSGSLERSSLSSSLSRSLSHHEDEPEESFVNISEPTVCSMCEEEDSLLRMKKRCKNCSGVFCESCVANELPLPSSILPETVCSACYSQLLQQYASAPT